MSLEYWVYINGVLQGTTDSNTWSLQNGIKLESGEYRYLPFDYLELVEWKVNVYDTEEETFTVGDDWWFWIEGTPDAEETPELPEIPLRPPQTIWYPGDEDNDGQWVSSLDYPDLFVAGGGRYRKQTVIITFDSEGKGRVLVEN